MQFAWVLFPVFCIFATGFIGQKVIQFDIKSLSIMTLYLMTPFLAFKAFYLQNISTDYVYYLIYLLGIATVLILLVNLLAIKMKYDLSERCAMILSSVFMNNGNYGVPVVYLVFGTRGMELAVVLSVLQQLLMSTLGFYYAAKGGEGSDSSAKVIFKRLIKLPVMYGAGAGILFQLSHITLPDNLMTAVTMIGDASIPVVMLVLGMQLATVQFKQIDIAKTSIALSIKLLISPLLACLIAWSLPVSLETKQIFILLAAMPTAASTTLLAVQFRTQPEMVSSATFFSTVCSLLTLPVVLSLLQPIGSTVH